MFSNSFILWLKLNLIFLLKQFHTVTFVTFFFSNSVIRRLILPHTPHQNGVVERKHRHIVEMALTMLSQASLPLEYWDNVVVSSVYLINRLPSSAIQNEVPYQNLFDKLPDYKFLVFGSASFPLFRPYN